MKSVISTEQFRKKLLTLTLPIALFLFAYHGGFHALLNTGARFFALYAQAELRKLEASGFVNAEGNEEYVVSVKLDQGSETERQFLMRQEGVLSAEPTDVPHWYVIEVSKHSISAAKEIRQLDQTGFVIANRGVWFCH